MTKDFSLSLAERVASVFAFAFLAAWVLGEVHAHQLAALGSLSLAQKAAAAGGAAVVQLILGVFVAPHVGDPNTPSLLPSRFTGRFAATPAQKQQISVSVDDVVTAVLRRLLNKVPQGIIVSHDDVVDVILKKIEAGAPVAVEDVANDLINQLVVPKPVELQKPQ